MHWTGKVESVAFTLFGKDVMWYGIIITSAMLIGLLLVIRLSKKIKLTSDDILELFLIAIPLAIVGARLGYVLLHADYFFVSPFGWDEFVDMIAIWNGGLTIITGAPFGILGGYLWAKKNKIDFLYFADNVVFVVLLSQALGRWGNFFNQELYGMPVTDPNLQYFPYAVFIRAEGAWHQATFFYEFVGNLLGFALLFFLSRHLKVRGSGIVGYAAVYAAIRAVMESMRITSLVNGVRYGVYVASALAIAGAALLVFISIRQSKKGQVWYPKGIPLSEYKPAKALPPKEESGENKPQKPGFFKNIGKKKQDNK